MMNETILNGKSMDIVADNIQKLKGIFPDVFTEGKVDFEKLEAVLGNYIEKDNERYNFTWHGKSQALRLAQTPSTGTLRPCKEESKDWDTTQNLYIEGDNLEVLKLLQKSYHNKVKMIYIDPPYNTGKDFVYPDNYKDNIQNYLEITGQVDGEGNKVGTNSESSGRYHTNWLNMMYPRLKLARNLLSDNGVIFVSIDDNEIDNLKKICNEIFGEENFVGCFLWRKKSTSTNVANALVSPQVDYQLCYSKGSNSCLNRRVTSVETRNYPLRDERGNYRATVIEKKDAGDYARETMKYQILGQYPREGKRWQIGEKTAREYEEQGRLFNDNGIIKLKIYEGEDKDTYSANPNLLLDTGSTDIANKETNIDLFSIPELFSNPKPLALLIHLLRMGTEEDSIILDFFSGSATTAHAIMQLNYEDNGKRKFIMVQFPEETDSKSEAFKNGFRNICEIGKERIRRAGNKLSNMEKDIDSGFKVLKLDSSNIKKWNPNYDNIEQTLYDHINNFVEGRTELDVVFEIMVKYGIDLTMPIEEYNLAGKKVYSIGFGALMICLDQNIDLEIAHEITKLRDELQPEVCRVVFKDNGFRNDDIKTNVKENLKVNHFDEIVSI